MKRLQRLLEKTPLGTRQESPFRRLTGRLPLLTGIAAAAGAAGLYLLVQKAREASLKDRVVLITGGSRGLGLQLAREFARQQARVVICARDPDELQRARRILAAGGVEVLTIPCDVSDRDQVEDLVTEVLEVHGRLDVLVNNAGVIQVGPMEAMEERDFEHALGVMFWGVLRTTLAALPHMRERGWGRIVNITSLGGLVSIPHMLPYTCAKFAAVGLSQGLRTELRPSGVKVTTVVPGTMRVGSHLQAEFRGREQEEYAWFSLAASTPCFSVSDRSAARQIVKAAQRGEAVRMLGLPASVLGRLHGLFPGLTAEVMGFVERLLPSAEGQWYRPGAHGAEVEAQMQSQLHRRLTALGRRAARRNNETRGDSDPAGGGA